MIKAIIFDFDGVLVDTFDKTLGICRELFSDLTVEQFKDHHNGNVFEQPVMPFTKKDEEYYDQEYLRRADAKHFFPLVDMVRHLSENYRLFVVSSNSELSMDKYFRLVNINGCFEKVLGYQTERSKVKKFKMICESYGFEPSECVLVTDTLGDILESKKVELKCIGVTWGYHEEGRLKFGRPDFIIHEFNDLIPTIKKLDQA